MGERGWRGIVWGVVASVVAAGVVVVGSGPVQARATTSVSFGDRMYTALSPSRLLDTRSGPGALGARSSLDVTAVGRGGVPAEGVGAVVLNLTGTEATADTYVTAFPAGEAVPLASNLNLTAGRTAPNLAIVKVGAGGRVSLYNHNGSVHLVVDVAGWFPVGSDYHGLTPARALDTRAAGGAVGPRRSVDVPVTGFAGVPATGVGAVVVNLTGTEPTADTYVSAYPAGEAVPLASNLNLTAGQTAPNLAIVKVGAGGRISLYNNNGATHLVVDVLGWIAAGADLAPLSPSRLLDTRSDRPVGPRSSIEVPVLGRGGVPAEGVAAVVVNLTGTEPTADTYVTAHPGGEPLPVASNLNLTAGQTAPNLVIVKVGPNGTVSLYNNNGSTHLVVDVFGWISTGVTATVAKPDTTDVVPPQQVVSVTPDGLTMTGPAPAVGEVVFAQPDDRNPGGHLGRVTAVTTSGGSTTVRTTPVRIDEAFPSGSVQGSADTRALAGTAAGALAGKAAQDGAIPPASANAGVDCGGRPLTVSVDLAVQSRVVLDLAWGAGGLERFSITAEAELRGSVGFTAGFAAECDFPVGPTIALPPVWGFVPKLTPVVQAKFEAGIGLSAQLSATVRFGAVLDAGRQGVRWIREADVTGSMTPPSDAASATLRVTFGPRVQLAFGGVAGPSLLAGAFVETKISPTADPWWTVDAGASAQASLDVDFWFLRASYTLAQADFLRYRLATAGGTWPGPRLAGGRLPSGQRSLPYSTTVTAQSGTAPVVLTVVGGALPPGLVFTGGTISGTPTQAGQSQFTVRARDAQGRTATGTFTLTVLTPGGAGTIPLPGAPAPREFTLTDGHVDDLGPSGETLYCAWNPTTRSTDASYLHRDGSRTPAVPTLCQVTSAPGAAPRGDQQRRLTWGADGWSYATVYDPIQGWDGTQIRGYGPDGAQRWSAAYPRILFVHLTPDGSQLVVRSGSYFHVLDPATGNQRYAIDYPGIIHGEFRSATPDHFVLGQLDFFNRADGSYADGYPLSDHGTDSQTVAGPADSVLNAYSFNRMSSTPVACGTEVRRGQRSGLVWSVRVPAAYPACSAQALSADGVGGGYVVQYADHQARFTRVTPTGALAWTRDVSGALGRYHVSYSGDRTIDATVDHVVDARGRLAYWVARDQPCTGEDGAQATCSSVQVVVVDEKGTVLLDRTYSRYGWTARVLRVVGGFGQLYVGLEWERPGGELRSEVRSLPVPFDGDWSTARQRRVQP
ncbi:putative Ig domain-containing protein [Saccharothrix sp. S26]|uniref:putative Ig domain-containing protein n=1 Tax=Saccharothrix sp. S26 TaxID=2907215 RepID=UPI001F35AE52|nr:putative Ig domain-containing protein [Saccharothrix sp. S26]MCE6998286.1 putative Ig domain-containing protein [Saccharothrix sp. S26]